MGLVKVQLASIYRGSDVDATAGTPLPLINNRPVVWTLPGGTHALVNVPDAWGAAAVDQWAATAWTTGELVRDAQGIWRPEKEIGIPTPPPLLPGMLAGPLAVRRGTWAAHGITDALLESVGYGAGRNIGIGDSGVPPIAARENWFPRIEVVGNGTMDAIGHSTGVGSIIADALPEANLIFSCALPGAGGRGTELDVARAIRALADAGCEVINLSLGGAGRSGIIGDAVRYAQGRGAICVAAMGNDGPGGQMGSPGLESALVAESCTYDAPHRVSDFSTGGGRYASAGFWIGDPVTCAHLDGGYGDMRGTSFSAPHATLMAAIALCQGLNSEQTREAWRQGAVMLQPAPSNSRGRVQATVSEAPIPIPPPPSSELGRLAASLRHTASVVVVNGDTARYVLRDADPEAAWRHVGESMRLIEQDFLPVLDALEAEAGKGQPTPGPDPPPPPPPVLAGFGGSYPGHDPAFDLYPNGPCGPHGGVPLQAPAAGTVERYSFATPLNTTRLGELSWSGPPGLSSVEGEALFQTLCATAVCTLGTSMHIAVLRFDTPLRLADGTTIAVLWCGHVRGDFKTGRVNAGDVFAVCGESGLEFPGGVEASHVHVCGSRTGTLSPNGDVSGLLVARALGFEVRDVGLVPGPQAYYAGRTAAYRGYLGYGAWQAAGCR